MKFKAWIFYALILILLGGAEFSFGQKRLRKESSKQLEKKDLIQAEKYFIEGVKYFILDDHAKAYVFFQKSLEINQDNAASHFKIAQILTRGEDYDKALMHILKALELSPQNEFYYVQAVDIYTKKGSLDEAAN